MSKNTKKKSLTDWDWTTLVAAWRYYEHGHTIASAMFPHEIVTRFFTGAYDEESCKKIARQFVDVDHCKGPDDKISGWVGDDAFGASDRMAWRLFYFYLFAWHYRCFSKTRVTIGGKADASKYSTLTASGTLKKATRGSVVTYRRTRLTRLSLS